MGNCTQAHDGACQNRRSSFNFIKLLGKGSFSKVWKAYSKKDNKNYAVKVLKKWKVIATKSLKEVHQQRQILCALRVENSKFISNIKCTFQNKHNLYLVLELIEGVDLRTYLNSSYSFNEDQIKFIIKCIIQGLKLLRTKNVCHCDIKPENIIFDDLGYGRIVDFGLAKYFNSDQDVYIRGTTEYMAPQTLLGQNFNFCSDYYSVGIIAYELIMGRRPYQNVDRKTLRDEILSKEISLTSSQCKGRISQEGVDFINRLFVKAPRKRIGFADISELTNHKWLQTTPEQTLRFEKKQICSPMPVLQSNALSSDTVHELQSSECQDQNIEELLKRQEMQSIFEAYNYINDHHNVFKNQSKTQINPENQSRNSRKRLTTIKMK